MHSTCVALMRFGKAATSEEPIRKMEIEVRVGKLKNEKVAVTREMIKSGGDSSGLDLEAT